MSTSSVFPLEIYEHILELVMENAPYESYTMLYTFSYVCTAWRWKCRALGFRYLALHELSVAAMHIVRRKLTANPHLAALVENVELHILLSASPYQSIIEGFPSMLGRFLPRLRSVTIVSSTRPIYFHRHFSIRRVLLHSVTVLEVSNILFDKNLTFEWFIAPFPSLRVLDLWSIAWTVAPNLSQGMPPLTELELRLKGINAPPAWMKDNRDAYERLLNATRCTLRSFSVNIFSLYILTSLHDYKSEDFCLSALEVLSVELHIHPMLEVRGKDGKELPYRQCIADIVSFLARMDAKTTRILNLSFYTGNRRIFFVSDDDFLDCLRNLRKGLEDLVIGDHFPSLQAINIVVVGAGEAAVPIWQDRFNSCFPYLAERGLLHVKEHIPREPPQHHI